MTIGRLSNARRHIDVRHAALPEEEKAAAVSRMRSAIYRERVMARLPYQLSIEEAGAVGIGSTPKHFKCLLCNPTQELLKVSAGSHFKHAHGKPNAYFKDWVTIGDGARLKSDAETGLIFLERYIVGQGASVQDQQLSHAHAMQDDSRASDVLVVHRADQGDAHSLQAPVSPTQSVLRVQPGVFMGEPYDGPIARPQCSGVSPAQRSDAMPQSDITSFFKRSAAAHCSTDESGHGGELKNAIFTAMLDLQTIAKYAAPTGEVPPTRAKQIANVLIVGITFFSNLVDKPSDWAQLKKKQLRKALVADGLNYVVCDTLGAHGVAVPRIKWTSTGTKQALRAYSGFCWNILADRTEFAFEPSTSKTLAKVTQLRNHFNVTALLRIFHLVYLGANAHFESMLHDDESKTNKLAPVTEEQSFEDRAAGAHSSNDDKMIEAHCQEMAYKKLYGAPAQWPTAEQFAEHTRTYDGLLKRFEGVLITDSFDKDVNDLVNEVHDSDSDFKMMCSLADVDRTCGLTAGSTQRADVLVPDTNAMPPQKVRRRTRRGTFNDDEKFAIIAKFGAMYGTDYSIVKKMHASAVLDALVADGTLSHTSESMVESVRHVIRSRAGADID